MDFPVLPPRATAGLVPSRELAIQGWRGDREWTSINANEPDAERNLPFPSLTAQFAFIRVNSRLVPFPRLSPFRANLRQSADAGSAFPPSRRVPPGPTISSRSRKKPRLRALLIPQLTGTLW